MTKIAVIKTGGKQYKVQEGEIIKIEKLKNAVGEKINFDTLLIADANGQSIDLGAPTLGAKTTGQVMENGIGKKVTVVKYKNKTRYLKIRGHRQLYTKVKITSIGK
ncbi:MAG: 50S ribosomal protein L21 [Candidatus Falkowbacteria bacterium]|nr:50S ribosomal protein L21 [Candidatus Falkowbacteria bacterium]